MRPFTSLSRPSLLLFGLGALLACGGPENLSEEETFATTSSALCTQSGAEDVWAVLGAQPGDTVSGTSSNGWYGSTECPGAYVVEAVATAGKEIVISATWVDSAVRNNPALCRDATLFAFAYGVPQGSYAWSFLGNITVKGSWDDTFGCSFMWVPEHAVKQLPSSHNYTRLRVGARAYTGSVASQPYHRVKASITVAHPLPPPPGLAPDASR